MQSYDVIIVGAGPAGGQCARELSSAGRKVLLVEKAKDFTVNNYSSAGAPIELMHDFNLPESIVGSSWNKIMMHSSHDKNIWESPQRGGVIMDFAKLRKFLSDEAIKQGADLQFNSAYQSYQHEKGTTLVTFKEGDNFITQKTRVLVDASGSKKEILGKHVTTNSFPSTGIEYLVEVDPLTYQKWANALSVFMGLDWMPQGYSWIFPMEPNQLKIGIGRYFTYDHYVPYEKSFQFYLDHMIDQCLDRNHVKILDKHGKTVLYTYGQKDPLFDKNIVAIGDSISMINPLAFEGIRHAMVSGRIAAEEIGRYLDGKTHSFVNYKKRIGRYCGNKWNICEFLMHRIYREPDDHKMDLMVKTFKSFTFDEMIDLAFHYKFSLGLKFYLGYTFRKIFS